jgi:hypothetical protein
VHASSSPWQNYPQTKTTTATPQPRRQQAWAVLLAALCQGTTVTDRRSHGNVTVRPQGCEHHSNIIAHICATAVQWRLYKGTIQEFNAIFVTQLGWQSLRIMLHAAIRTCWRLFSRLPLNHSSPAKSPWFWKSEHSTVEPGYNVMKGTRYFVWL